MYNLIILTTATCRPNIHNMTFSKKALRFLDNIKMPIKWFINIDKTRVCPSDQETTKNNFKTLLSDYDINFIVSKTPGFFKAFKNLLLKCEEFVNENTIIFNYEDDWIINKEFKLFDIIHNYYYKNVYISLVYNLFGTLPPFIMGFNLIMEYLNAFKTPIENTDSIDPEKHARAHFRQITVHENIPIHYFLVNYDIEDLKILLSKKNKITGKMKIDGKSFVKTFGNNSFTLNEPRYNLNNKNYLITNVTEITTDMIKEIKSVSEQEIQIISFDEFKIICEEYQQQNCFLCIKFGGTHTYMGDITMDYNNTYFRDLGRFIGESPKLA